MNLKELNLEELNTIEKKSVQGGKTGDAAEAIGYVIGSLFNPNFWEGWVMDTFH